MKSNFELMSNYNTWMNKSIYKASFTLSDEEVTRDQGAFFQSIWGTLNHVLVGDIIWLKRIQASLEKDTSQIVQALKPLDAFAKPSGLSEILYHNLTDLWAERQQIDSIISACIHMLTQEQLEGSIRYTNTKGDVFVKNLGQTLLHLFNHQTHHRGQVTTLLTQAGVDVGPTDMIILAPSVS